MMGNVGNSTETAVTGLYAHHYTCTAVNEQASMNLTDGFPGNWSIFRGALHYALVLARPDLA